MVTNKSDDSNDRVALAFNAAKERHDTCKSNFERELAMFDKRICKIEDRFYWILGGITLVLGTGFINLILNLKK